MLQVIPLHRFSIPKNTFLIFALCIAERKRIMAATHNGGLIGMNRLLVISAAIGVALAGSDRALAQQYPTKPVTIVVPFAAGGPTDALSRLLAERMTAALGQRVIVENVAGAAGSIGVGRVARAAPDGYTVGIGQWDTHVVNGAVYQLQYDLLNDFEPVSLLPSNPQLIVTKAALPVKNLLELVAWLKANPDKASQGTAGAGSAAHVSGAYFQKTTGTRFQFVPYRGAAPAMRDLVAGQIDLMFDQASNALPHVRAGKIRAHAVTAKTRLASASEIPTVDEAGLPRFHVSIWRGFWVPRGTPKAAIARLNSAVVETLADESVRRRLSELGQDIPPRAQQTPEALGAYHRAEVERWWPVIKGANIRPQ
jgi:tripartite-type tricarboxylate transporter receptor subunit TctC